MKDNYIELNIDGKIVKYEILYTLQFENNDKTYIIYTDNKYDKGNNLNVYVGEYNKSNNTVSNIEDDNVFNAISDIINSIIYGGDDIYGE